MKPIKNTVDLRVGQMVDLMYLSGPVKIMRIQPCERSQHFKECPYCWKVLITIEGGDVMHGIPAISNPPWITR
jgi:hypothetical protein